MMSSMMASASRITRTLAGMPRPSSASTPTAKAMSVAAPTAQPSRPRQLAVQRQEHQRRNDDAAHGRRQRQRRLPQAAQRPFTDLAADLHADDQEEHGHQRVVDPEVQRPLDHVAADPDHQRRMPQFVIAVLATANWPRPAPPAPPPAARCRSPPRCAGSSRAWRRPARPGAGRAAIRARIPASSCRRIRVNAPMRSRSPKPGRA